MSLNAEYANVVFPFDAPTLPDSTASIHLLGDFNFWLPGEENRLRFDEESGRWRTQLLIKEGVYRYKYVLIKNGKINDLYFDNFFSNRTQQYHAFVYMYDSREFYHRLLKVQEFYSQ
jgi:1,4-alpha-glucan branching enzyme